jgi:hypothetical protein
MAKTHIQPLEAAKLIWGRGGAICLGGVAHVQTRFCTHIEPLEAAKLIESLGSWFYMVWSPVSPTGDRYSKSVW